MFKRSLRIKSQTSVKKSERKSLYTTLSTAFGALSDVERIRLLFPEGEDIRILNASLAPSAATPAGPAKKDKSSIDSFNIYCDGKSQPLFFAFDVPKAAEKGFNRIILPTVYALWRVPDLLPLSFFTIHDVIAKMQNGADLMLAGANVPESTRQYIEDSEGTAKFGYASVSSVENGFPIVVGQLLMNREELIRKLAVGGEMKGRLLRAIHMVGDELWALGDKSGPPEGLLIAEPSMNSAADKIVVEAELPSDPSSGADMLNDGQQGNDTNNEPKAMDIESPDDLLRRAFLVALKSNALPEKYPILDSTLNSLMLATSRRLSSNALEIKQTSFKKFSTFLKYMETQKLLTLVKVKEGVQAVDGVVWKHPLFDGIEELPDEPAESLQMSLRIPTSVRQVYIVNGKALPLFSSVSPDIRKGYEFRSTDELKASVSQYIKSRDLVSKTDKGIINLDPLLVDLVMNKSIKFQGDWPMKWGELFDKILKEMSTTHEVVFTNGASVELKGKLVPLEVKVEKKAGNKLVTVVRYLEGLGMDPQEIAREIQKMVGATVGVREEGGAQKISQCVTIQGDQTKLLDKFFFQIVFMPKKFVTGLDKPGKKG